MIALMQINELHRGRLIDHLQLVVTDLERSKTFYRAPLGAWELVSAGPDGRVGTGDDVRDPSARVLRSGTPDAEAVARLEGVELGRASLALLSGADPHAGAVGSVPHQSDAPARRLARELWGTLPSRFEPDPEPLALRRPAHPGTGAGGHIALLPREGGSRASFRVDWADRRGGRARGLAGRDRALGGANRGLGPNGSGPACDSLGASAERNGAWL